ncbi:RicAFT regulatory complex protein RicA family protein [Staphylococcus simiae]|uniref:YmcA protein n=1 Tax=Staphylococcus simiae CCM 7213 = CCUG 51256 TaxID=911238 RepID=G5JIK9_9STAP|nr:YlbF family regulator [Staphylococcus simiae]EHJ07976.1 hypothetical protein SS7213T_06486 [Staphylococcus simiae CCM 7213 = CCUG 51256]PNZ12676.1 hypothetical protein CD113_06220 [Staphylococcus simiae]SNV69882.1 membrane protein [Staphylococcus simiae]
MYDKEQILQRADDIAKKIQQLDTIKQYRMVEEQIHRNQNIQQKMTTLKKHQKQSVNFQNYGQQFALQQSEHNIHRLEAEINNLPIVEQFRVSQFEANELLQMFISTMEKRLNQYNNM